MAIKRRAQARAVELRTKVAGAVLSLLLPMMALAEGEIRFTVPAGKLSSALGSLAEQADLQLVYDGNLVKGLKSSGLTGTLAPQAALAKLLEGTGLVFRFTARNTVYIEKVNADGARVLGPVRVEGAEHAGPPERGTGIAQLGGVRGGQSEEAIGYRAKVAAVAAGQPTALEDVPRSVSVLTQEQIQAQGIETLGEAVKRMPGTTLVVAAPGAGNFNLATSSLYSRGFQIQKIQIDGGASRSLNLFGNGFADLDAYERVELVRGPNGVFAGSESPGGSINLVRKRPGSFETSSITAAGGSFDRASLTGDYSTPSLFGSPFAFRTVAKYERQNFFYESASRENSLLYGILDAPLGEKARIEVGMQVNVVHEDGGYSGRYRYTDGPLTDVPFYNNSTPSWVYRDQTSKEGFARFFMEVSDRWNFDIGITHTDLRQATAQWAPNGGTHLLSLTDAPVPGVVTGSYLASEYPGTSSSQLGVDFRVGGKLQAFGLDHTLYVAGDFSENVMPRQVVQLTQNVTEAQRIQPILSSADLLSNRYPRPTLSRQPDSFSRGSSSAQGLVISDVISWRNRIDLTASLRHTEDENSSYRGFFDKQGNRSSLILGETETGQMLRSKPQWRPTYALTIKPLTGFSIYGSRADGSHDQSMNYTSDGKPLAPSLWVNSEIGMKYGAERWLATLARYDLVTRNQARSVPNSRGLCPPAPTSSCYFAQGDTEKSQGWDFEINGEVVNGLSLIASFNYNTNETISSSEPLFTFSPTRAGQLFLDWTPTFVRGTSVRMGAKYRGRVYQTGTQTIYDPITLKPIVSVPFQFADGARTVIDVGIKQALTDHIKLDLFVENVTDKEYFEQVGSTVNYAGAPRTFTLTAKWENGRDASSGGPHSTTGRAPFGDPVDWYGAFDAGVHSLDLKGTSDGHGSDGRPVAWRFDSGNKAFPAVRLGYRMTSHWRAELDGGFRLSNFSHIGGNAAAPTGVCYAAFSQSGAPFNCSKAQGEATTWSLTANALYDFMDERAFVRPFLGLGVGLARASIDFSGKMAGIGPNTVPWTSARITAEGIAADDQTVGFAGQLLAGASFRLSDRARIDATYRYYLMPNAKWESFNMPTLTPALGTFRGDYKDQSLTVGLRWAFGARP